MANKYHNDVGQWILDSNFNWTIYLDFTSWIQWNDWVSSWYQHVFYNRQLPGSILRITCTGQRFPPHFIPSMPRRSNCLYQSYARLGFIRYANSYIQWRRHVSLSECKHSRRIWLYFCLCHHRKLPPHYASHLSHSYHSFIHRRERTAIRNQPQEIEDTCALIKPNDVYQSSNKTLIVGFARNETSICIPEVIAEIISEYSTFELFRFGGRSAATQFMSFDDSFYIGTLKDEDPTQPIKWKLAPQYKLKHPMIRFGCIQYGCFIVTFGGLIQDGRFKLFTDSIYILNLHGNCGWIESPIKLPKNQRLAKIVYKGYWLRAVLDESKRVHLNGMYSIDLMDILPLEGSCE